MAAFGFILISLFSVIQAGNIMKEHSLTGPYADGSDPLQTWDITGSTELAGSFVRLTPDEVNKKGGIWNNYPCFANNWEMQALFGIHGKGVHLNGDGMALWYISEADMLKSGPVFGSKDYFSGLGVFIDTFGNHEGPHQHRHPYISAVVNNGSIHYEHNEYGTVSQLGGCHVQLRNLQVPTRIAVSYINKEVAVYVDNDGQWRLCFKSLGVHLPSGYHFGISASTSEVTDNHDILGMTTLNMDTDETEWEDRTDIIPYAENIEVPQKHHKDFIEEQMREEKKKEQKKQEQMREEKQKEEQRRQEQLREEKQKEEQRRQEQMREEKKKEQMKKEEKKREQHKKEEKKRDTREAEKKKEAPQTSDSTKEEISSPGTSFTRKLVYITGATVIILVSISVFNKYRERRRIRMEKLF